MPLPYSGDNDFNILHSWITAIFWLHGICPEMNPGNGTAIINRIKNTLVDGKEDIFIEDINETEDNCRLVIGEYYKVIMKHPEFISYWRFQKRKDETVREYEFKVEKINKNEIAEGEI